MKIATIILVLAASMMSTACVSEKMEKDRGPEKTVNVNTADFNQISIAGSFSVHFTQDNTTSIKMHGKEKDLEKTEIKTDGDKLYIGKKSKKNMNIFLFGNTYFGDVDIYITSPNLRSVEIAGSGDFTSKEKIDTDNMKISVAGSGDVEMKDLICNSISADIAGSGSIEIKKISTANAKLSIAGSGDIKMDNANIGNAESDIAGSGSIMLKGNIKSHHEDIAGSGSVKVN